MNAAYKNKQLPIEERVGILLEQMTLEEKIGQMIQISISQDIITYVDGSAVMSQRYLTDEEIHDMVFSRHTGSFLHATGEKARRIQEMALSSRLGIPVLFGIDAIHGHCIHNGSTVFPTQLGMSCSWNPDLVEEMGRVTAREVAADGLHWTFSPVLCLGRDTRWGRIDETFGEDPYLAGEMGAAIIKGYQGKDLSEPDSIMACAKHFIAYGESTGGRDSYDSQITGRKLRDTFLPPFRKAIEAGCATVMAGYQTIDGVPMSANKELLKGMLKEELGFKGYVVTDWNNTGHLISTQNTAKDMEEASRMVIEAGNDMIMNTPEFYDAALTLVRNGAVQESLIDSAVGHILFIKFKMGLFDGNHIAAAANRTEVFSNPVHLDINLRLARESVVLLENKNNTLPLKKELKKIAVIGPNADDIKSQYGDWSCFTHPFPNDSVPERPYYTMLEGIREAAAAHEVQVVYHKGCEVMDKKDASIHEAVRAAAASDVIVAVVGDCIEQNGEFRDRADLNLSGAQLQLLQALKDLDKPLVVILVNGKPLSVPWVKENADALLETFNSGMFGGKAAGEILFGKTNPNGRLSISFPYHSGQLPVYYNQIRGWHGGRYMDMPAEPLYAFGYGLSYSVFRYDGLTLSREKGGKDDLLYVQVNVTNISGWDGCETVQLYVRSRTSSFAAPVRQLKGFKKLPVKAGETCPVVLPLPVCELSVANDYGQYILESGIYDIMAGPDSREQSLLKASFQVV